VASPSLSACEREIERLHAFFVRWFQGEADPDEFERVERALAPGFERVSPDGDVHGRDVILERIREIYDRHDEFDIEIRNVEQVRLGGDWNRTLVRYEEWQTSPEGSNGRLSSALFAPVESGTGDGDSADRQDSGVDCELSVRWEYLHETWLE